MVIKMGDLFVGNALEGQCPGAVAIILVAASPGVTNVPCTVIATLMVGRRVKEKMFA